MIANLSAETTVAGTGTLGRAEIAREAGRRTSNGHSPLTCGACGRGFTTVTDFDQHRTANFRCKETT